MSVAQHNIAFDNLFASAGLNLTTAAQALLRRFTDFPDTDVDHAQIKSLEHVGDQITREVIELLNTGGQPGFDRQDAFQLASELDDVVDHIEHASELLDLYRVEAPMQQAIAQCELIASATEQLAKCLQVLPNFEGATKHIARIDEIEDEGDRVVRKAIAALFEHEQTSPRTIIQWKDLFEILEDAIDACDKAAHVISNVKVKST